MFGKEIYRILSRKITLLAMFVVAAISLFFAYQDVLLEYVMHDGREYDHEQAIAIDKVITEEFAGPLTEETVRAIWEKYGMSAYSTFRYFSEEELLFLAERGESHNFCNDFVTSTFAQVVQKENGKMTFTLPEDLSEAPFLDGSYIFGYTGKGWQRYWELARENIIMISIVCIIALCSIFSEDYAFKTADISLPTVKGRFNFWLHRTGICFFFASAYYWFLCGISFLRTCIIYGTEGLSVSCALAGVPYYWMENSAPLWKGFLILHLGGWFSMLVLILQVQAISAKCKSSFGSILWSLAAYFGPFALIRAILNNLPANELNMWLQKICYSMPFSFAGLYVQAPPSGKQTLIVFALLAAVLSAVLGARIWCRHEVRN